MEKRGACEERYKTHLLLLVGILFQVYTERKAVVKRDTERVLWDQIDYSYMTEYSEGEIDDEEVVYRNYISWRSDSKLMHTQ